MGNVEIWLIGTVIYGGLFAALVLAWVLVKILLGYSRAPFPSLCGLSCFGFYAWAAMGVLTAFGVLDCVMQVIAGFPLILAWPLAQIAEGNSASYLVSRLQYPPQRQLAFPGGFLTGLVFWQVAFYTLPTLLGLPGFSELPVVTRVSLVGSAWSSQLAFLVPAYKCLR